MKRFRRTLAKLLAMLMVATTIFNSSLTTGTVYAQEGEETPVRQEQVVETPDVQENTDSTDADNQAGGGY